MPVGGNRDTRAALVQVCNVDRTLLVRVDGRELLRCEYEPPARELQLPGFARAACVWLGCTRGHVVFKEPAIFVDVYYTSAPDRYAVREPFHVPEGAFSTLGDNSVNSNDGRAWGGVPREHLVGKATDTIWPLGRARELH
jgi:hypothetical protein